MEEKIPEKKSSINFQYIGTIVALVISCMALAVSVYEAQILKSQQKALVWPYVKVDVSYSSKGFSINANNNGIGPALIKSLEVSFDGTAVKNYDELLDAMKPDRSFGYNIISVGKLNDTVLKAGEERRLLQIPFTEETRSLLKQIEKVNFKLQYSSVLGSNWSCDLLEGKVKEGIFKATLEFEQ